MKAFKLTALNEMEIMEIPDPGKPGKGELLIRVEAVGVCGSDVHYYVTGRIGTQIVEYPFTVGHEFSGAVVECGDETPDFKSGDRVAVDPAMPCYECDQCRQGREHTCRNLRFLGCPGQAEGSMSEYILMPAGSCFRIPESMSFEAAAFVEPLSIGLYAMKLSDIKKGDKVAVLGAGPIGDSVLVSAKDAGAAEIYVTEKINERIAIALKLGAKAGYNVNDCEVVKEISTEVPELLDIVYECCGEQDALDQAVQLLKPGGKLVIAGIPRFDRWSVSAEDIRRKEISIINVRRQNECMQPALDMIAVGKVNTGLLITHRFPFEKAKEAFDLVAAYNDGVLKAMIKF